jgi:hypothetical protein
MKASLRKSITQSRAISSDDVISVRAAFSAVELCLGGAGASSSGTWWHVRPPLADVLRLRGMGIYRFSAVSGPFAATPWESNRVPVAELRCLLMRTGAGATELEASKLVIGHLQVEVYRCPPRSSLKRI